MKKLGIVAALAAGVMGAAAPAAIAGGPEVAPCATVSELFETANVQVEPLPEPLGSTAGTVYRTTCSITG